MRGSSSSFRILIMKLAALLAGFFVLSLLDPISASGQSSWRLSAEPTLEIGTVDGAASLAFHDIRGAISIQDSLVIVADGGTRELRVFSSSGDFISSFGRAGGGPKEFEGIGWAKTCGGDTVVVYDFARHRITKWDADGTLRDEFFVEGPGGTMPPSEVDCGPAGTFVVVGWPNFLAYSGGVGPYRFDVDIGLLDREGRLEQVLGTFPGPDRYRYTSNDGPRPLGKKTIARMGVDGAYVGTADSFQIQQFLPGGAQHTIGRPISPRRLDGQLLRDWRESIIRNESPDLRPATRRALDEHQVPETLPAYSDFQLDKLGRIWVAHYGMPGEEYVQWDVFERTGIHLASMNIPSGFRPTEIGEDYLLGVTTDTLGVERVHRYKLLR
jgi:hypothetical protein